MANLRSLRVSARKEIDNAIIVRLQHRDSTRNVGDSMNVFQSYVARIRKEKLNDLKRNLGNRPPLFNPSNKRACVRVVTLGGCEVAMQATQHLYAHMQVSISVDTLRRAL